MTNTRQTVRITPAKVRHAMDAGRASSLWDRDVRGFGLRVTANGTASWFIDYYTVKGKRRRWTFDRLEGRPSKAKVKAARDKARDLLEVAAQGDDPRRGRRALRNTATVDDLWESFRESHVRHKAAGTQRMYESLFERFILPELGDMLVQRVTWADVDAIFRDVSEDTPTQADRLVATVRTAFKYAQKQGWYPLGGNPGEGHDLNSPKPQKRSLTRPELATYGARLRDDDSMAARCLELALYTGARLDEVLMMSWDRVDLDKRLMFLEDGDSKTGARPIYLGGPAVELLAGLERFGTAVFPSPKGEPYGDVTYAKQGYKTCWSRLSEGTSFEDLTPYMASRHTFITYSDELQIEKRRRELLSGHAPAGGAREGYSDKINPDVIAGLLDDADLVASFLAAALEGKAPSPGEWREAWMARQEQAGVHGQVVQFPASAEAPAAS